MAAHVAHAAGRPWMFALAVVAVAGWAVCGPVFHFSDTWQLVINTSTTIITFLMVFIIQNTQNRDSHAVHLKLDELIRASRVARNRLLDAEQFTEDELDHLQREFDRLAEETLARRERTERGSRDAQDRLAPSLPDEDA